MPRAALLLSACLLLSCTAAAPPAPAPLLPAPPAERLAAVRAGEQRIRTMRARFTSVAHVGGGEQRKADGVLVVAKPDRFRLRLMLPLGLTVFDLLAVGDRTWVALPLAGERTGDVTAIFSREDLGAAFLRGPHAFPGTCDATAAGGDEVVVTCGVDADVRRTLRLDRTGIVEETTFEGGEPRLHIRYADRRHLDGVTLPYRITLEYPQRARSVEIAIDGYELNPALPEAAFAPPPQAVVSGE